ncbi:MAG TPA: hypothetical protein VN808_08285, partial [Stellaceae bacterium]|nr:hypothetical protein [Stellaceae bacterium]
MAQNSVRGAGGSSAVAVNGPQAICASAEAANKLQSTGSAKTNETKFLKVILLRFLIDRPCGKLAIR